MKPKITCREIDDNVLSMTSTSSFHHNLPPPPPPHFNHMTNRSQCYETDDNDMKPKITCREIDDNVLSMTSTSSFHHPPHPILLTRLIDDNVMKPMTMP